MEGVEVKWDLTPGASRGVLTYRLLPYAPIRVITAYLVQIVETNRKALT